MKKGSKLKEVDVTKIYHFGRVIGESDYALVREAYKHADPEKKKVAVKIINKVRTSPICYCVLMDSYRGLIITQKRSKGWGTKELSLS